MTKIDKGFYIGTLKIKVKNLQEKEIKRIEQIKMLENKITYWKNIALGVK